MIEAARRELAARGTTSPELASAVTSTTPTRPAPPRQPSTTAQADVDITQRDPATRAAALIQTGKEESLRRRRRARQMAMVVPTLILIGATLWALATVFRW